MTTLRTLLSTAEERQIPAIHRHILHKYIADLTIKDLSDVGPVIIQSEKGFIPEGSVAGMAYEILRQRAKTKEL